MKVISSLFFILVSVLSWQTFAAPMPDVIITSVSWKNQGDGYALFSATVQNIGDAATPAGAVLGVGFYVDGALLSFSGTYNGSLAPGKSVILQTNSSPTGTPWVKPPTDLHRFVAVVNDIVPRRFAESSYDNNIYPVLYRQPHHFYGINGHQDYINNPAFTPEVLASELKKLGVTYFRVDVGGDDQAVARALAITKSLTSSGIQVLPVIAVGSLGTPGNDAKVAEQSAYDAGYQLGAKYAKMWAGTGVQVWEAGNELDRQEQTYTMPQASGNQTSDYKPNGLPRWRGTLRGLIAGIKSAQPSAFIGVDFCGADFVASDMLWNGTDPNGKSTYADGTAYPVVRWDVTMWHNYESYGTMWNPGLDGAISNTYLNIPERLKRYGKPVWVTEWGQTQKDDKGTRAQFVKDSLQQYWNHRTGAPESNAPYLTDGAIDAIFLYQLGGIDDYGIINYGNPTTYSNAYKEYQYFIQQHPDYWQP